MTVEANRSAKFKAELLHDFNGVSELSLPKMRLDDFTLIVVLGKGSFEKVSMSSALSFYQFWCLIANYCLKN